MLEPDPLQHLLRLATLHGRGHAHDRCNERGVFENRHPPDELEVLEQEYEFAFANDERQVTQCVDVTTVGLGKMLGLYHSSVL